MYHYITFIQTLIKSYKIVFYPKSNMKHTCRYTILFLIFNFEVFSANCFSSGNDTQKGKIEIYPNSDKPQELNNGQTFAKESYLTPNNKLTKHSLIYESMSNSESKRIFDYKDLVLPRKLCVIHNEQQHGSLQRHKVNNTLPLSDRLNLKRVNSSPEQQNKQLQEFAESVEEPFVVNIENDFLSMIDISPNTLGNAVINNNDFNSFNARQLKLQLSINRLNNTFEQPTTCNILENMLLNTSTPDFAKGIIYSNLRSTEEINERNKNNVENEIDVEIWSTISEDLSNLNF